MGKGFLAEGKLANSPDLGVLFTRPRSVSCSPSRPKRKQEESKTHRLQGLLDLRVESTGLDGNDRRGSIRVVGNGRATLRAEYAVDVLARAALASPALGGAVDGELVLGHDGDESCQLRC